MQYPTLKGIQRATQNINKFFQPTPLIKSEILSEAFSAEIWLKNETVSPVASFKYRGALNVLINEKEKSKIKGAVTSSTGNHGQGVAFASKLLGIPAYIFLPEVANPVKKAMIKSFGATIFQIGKDIDEAKEQAKEFCKKNGMVFVDDGENPELIEGAGTVGLEIATTLHNIDTVFVPMGSGSLASGCAAAIKSVQAQTRVVAVQSAQSPAMVESFFARKSIEKTINTIADGIVCRVPAELALFSLWKFVDDAMLVDDEEILSAVHTLIESAHIMVEPSGAASLAGAWQRRDDLKGKEVVLVLTGSNITMPLLNRALSARSLLWN